MTVLSHSQNGAVSFLVDWMPYNACCLALFMFGSGYFYNPKVDERPWSYILKKVRRLLVPMYIYNVCYGFLGTLLHKAGFAFGGKFTLYNVLVAPLNNGHQFDLNIGSWYLAPLFMIECFNVLFRSKLRQTGRRIPEFWIFLLYLALGKSKVINQIADSTFSVMMNHVLGFLLINVVYAFLSRHFAFFSDFDPESYRSSVWLYQVHGVKFSLILYPIMGIAVSLLIQKIIDGVKQVVTS